MKDSESDKTRLQPGAAKKTVASEKTRIAKPRTATGGENEKTRIAPPAQQPNPDSQRTRIKQDNKKDRPAADATRYRPRATAQPDRTRHAPPRIKDRASATTQPDHSGDIQTDKHVLKERFVLEEVLGTGGMGIVYRAKDLLMEEAQDRDPYVAIKVLNEEFKTHPEAFISLQRESRKSQRIAHPNIVNVYDFDRDEDTVFMTMEYLDGDPLDELINRYQSTGLPTDYAWEIIQGMALALSHAHAERIIHSDFKPGNVFVTRKGQIKVFDFGIARAVAQVEHLEDNPHDQTLFDAGNLGALTPAYASLEMLEGEEPDIRDDIYALGCVAYEILTGEHPYRKVPADEAERQGLKPARITQIKGAQWRAIEKAIAFRRENRMATVDEFMDGILPRRKSLNWLVTALALFLLVAISTYFMFFKESSETPEFSEFDIRNEIELKIRIDLYKESIEALIKNANFSDLWQESIRKDISDLTILTKGNDAWVDEKKLIIYGLYLAAIQSEFNSKQYSRALQLIENGKQYATDETELALFSRQIQIELGKAKERQARQAQENKKQKQALLAQQLQQKEQQQKKAAQLARQQQDKQQRSDKFGVALENVNNQLKCQASLDMRNLEIAIRKLKQLDQDRYRALEKNIVDSLAACIVQIGKAFPERAEAARKHGTRIFNSATLAGITIKSRDPCDRALAGLGASKRAICRDILKAKGNGPDMVVIPGSSKIPSFAIGKYEVSVAELNKYCEISKACQPLPQDAQLPVSNIPLQRAKNYLKWLSRETGKKYRLPDKNEWIYAARSRSKNLDPNRNCELSTRGFKKGDELLKYSVGKQNDWGLVNYVGNVQEWVYDKGRQLQAVGGSFQQPMESCTVNTGKSHDGKSDNMTGFRVLREIES